MLDALLLDSYLIWRFYHYVGQFSDTVVFCILHSYSVRTYLKTCKLVVISLPIEGAIGLLQSIVILT